MTQGLHLRIANRLPELHRVCEQVEEFLHGNAVCGRDAYHIQLTLDELLTNVISYAYAPGEEQGIDIRLEREPQAVLVTISDRGRPFNPLETPAPDVHAAAEHRPVGGLGIHFARKMMDMMEYERAEGQNILRIRKNIT